jgi:uncharacterized membrane protein required for colicin V production
MKLIVRALIVLVKAIVVLLLLASALAFVELVVQALDTAQWLRMQGK